MTLIDLDVLLDGESRLVDAKDLGAVDVSHRNGDHLKTEIHAILLSAGEPGDRYAYITADRGRRRNRIPDRKAAAQAAIATIRRVLEKQ